MVSGRALREAPVQGRRPGNPETEPADRHANEETVEVAGDGDHEQRQAIDDRSGKDEDLPSASPVREPATHVVPIGLLHRLTVIAGYNTPEADEQQKKVYRALVYFLDSSSG